VGVAFSCSSFGIGDDQREGARAVEVEVFIEAAGVELIDARSVPLGDELVAHPFAQYPTILGFDQGVVIGVTGP